MRILIHLQVDRDRNGQSSASMPHMGRRWEPACIYSSLQIQLDRLVSRDSSDRNKPDWLSGCHSSYRSGSSW